MILGNMKVSLGGINEISRISQSVLSFYYAPLMRAKSLKLYHVLLSLNTVNISLDYSLLAYFTGLSVEDLEECRIELEKLMLIKTGQFNSGHHIECLAPKTATEFKKHPLLGRLYISVMGHDHMKLVGSLFSETISMNDLTDISQMLTLNDLKNYKEEYEEPLKAQKQEVNLPSFNIQSFLVVANEAVFPKKVRTPENIEMIATLATRYKLTIHEMINYVAQSLSRKNDHLNLKKLAELCGSQLIEIPTDESNPFKWSMAQFLQSKMGNVPVLDSTLATLESIKTKYSFDDSIMNVLIDYALNHNKGILTKRYLDTIASTMHLNKVKDYQDAINHFASIKPKQASNKKVIKHEKYTQEVDQSIDQEQEKQSILEVLDSWN